MKNGYVHIYYISSHSPFSFSTLEVDMTMKCISFAFDQCDMLLSLHIGFSFVRAAVACAILERTSDSEPLSETIAPR